ncbi:hypothetical protein TNCV_1134751 [Trichonephila clavipes]|nr:hypothetical protein TNCV_1134751 [Trichonephila clavipes]
MIGTMCRSQISEIFIKEHKIKLALYIIRLGDCEVACPPRKPKVVGSIPVGVDRFSGRQNHSGPLYTVGLSWTELELTPSQPRVRDFDH